MSVSAWHLSANYCYYWGESAESMVVMLILLLHLLVLTVDLQSNCRGSVQLITSKFTNKTLFHGYMYSVCTIVAEITGTHHQPMLLDLPSTILSTHQFYFQDWGFSSFCDFVNLLA